MLAEGLGAFWHHPELAQQAAASQRDRILGVAMGERLYEAAKEPKRFIKVEGAGHHNLSGAGFDQYRSAIAELFGGQTPNSIPGGKRN